MPLAAGESLIALLALGGKLSGATYKESDLLWLSSLASQAGPLLAQAVQIENLERVHQQAVELVPQLNREKEYHRALSALYGQFLDLVSPALRASFPSFSELEHVQEENGVNLENFKRQFGELQLSVNNLITIAHRLRQQRGFEYETVSLEHVVNRVVSNLRAMAEARRVHVQVVLDPNLPTIVADESHLADAIQNLLHNAIKFNKIGGVVRLEGCLSGNEILLQIRDSGVGIPARRLENIWTEAASIQPSLYRGKSPGLGLLLTRYVVNAHGGRVDVESEYGAGSTFSLHLPLFVGEEGGTNGSVDDL